jgi:hypothetical protein
MRKSLRAVLTFSAALLVVLMSTLTWAGIHKTRPVLFQLFKETNCACGDYHQELSGFTVLNPFRDRAADRAVNMFLTAMQKRWVSADLW